MRSTAILVGCFCCAAFCQQSNLARVEGHVSDSLGQPLYRVKLTLSAEGQFEDGSRLPTGTDTYSEKDGNFVFDSVPPGRYRIHAQKTGFDRATYNTALTLAAGQTLSGIRLQMNPLAGLSGSVMDEDGNPLSKWRVAVLRRQYTGGHIGMRPRAVVYTNEDGAFTVKNIEAGQYYVLAQPHDARKFKLAAPGREDLQYGRTYYPDGTEASQAVAITLTPGAEFSAASIKARKTVVHVRGRVDPLGPMANWSERPEIILMPPDSVLGTTTITTRLAQDGSFELTDVPPGNYTLVGATMASSMHTYCFQDLVVGDRDLDNVIISAHPRFSISGAIKIEGRGPQSNGNFQAQADQFAEHVALRSPFPADSGAGATANPDGSFLFQSVYPGKFYFSISGIPDDAYLASLKLDGVTVDPSDLDLTHASASRLEVTLKAAAGSIDGSVQDKEGHQIPGEKVTLIPDPPNPRELYLYRTLSSDQGGNFSLKSLAPGKYLLIAWDDLEAGAEFDPDVIRNHVERAVSVTIEENNRQTLTVIPVPASN
jgi:protocatechuate 3,4-dioxygenase beta subunit